jgi:beta-lactamase regulating signal transducer with metallopeptidase domain
VSTLAMLLLVAGETLGLGVAFIHSVRAVFSRAGQLAVREAGDLSTSGTLATCPPAVQAQRGMTGFDDSSSTFAVRLPVSDAPPGDVVDSSVAVRTAEPAATGPASSAIALRWEVWFLAAWCTGCVVMTWRMGCRRLRLWLLTRRSQPVGKPRWPESLPQLTSQLGVRRRLRVIESDSFPTPATFGVLHPTIVLPVTFSAQYDQRQQRAVLAHEVAHLAAGDALWMCLADAVCVMLWWHVLSWWSRAKLREACECAADEGSLIFPDGPETLAECLVVMGRRLADRNKLAWLSIEGSAFRSHLGRRVEHLLRLPQDCPARTGTCPHTLTKIALVMVLVFTTFLTTAWIRSQAVPDRGESNVNVLKLSWRRSLAAAVVVPLLASLSQDPKAADPVTGTSATPVAAQESR